VQAAEAWSAHGAWVRAHPGVLGADVTDRFEAASRITPFQLTDARASLAARRTALDVALEGRILLLPSSSSTAPSRAASAAEVDAARAATLSLTCLAAIGGYPAVSAPVFEVAGAPLGLGLVGPRHSDLALVDLAARIAATLATGAAASVG
jgi:Asp-tRNA(Asn)/Glu-tRNA(Gln) amidotransferase A subunit family amidase